MSGSLHGSIDDLEKIADALDRAERVGEPSDTPEGVRRVWLSDTLAHQWSAALRAMVEILQNVGRNHKPESGQ